MHFKNKYLLNTNSVYCHNYMYKSHIIVPRETRRRGWCCLHGRRTTVFYWWRCRCRLAIVINLSDIITFHSHRICLDTPLSTVWRLHTLGTRHQSFESRIPCTTTLNTDIYNPNCIRLECWLEWSTCPSSAGGSGRLYGG